MEQRKNILLTVFHGTSSERLMQNNDIYKTLILPNDKIKDSQLLIETISREKFDYVISLGQKPSIKDKVYIETTARDGEEQIITSFDCEKLQQLFEQKGMTAKLSGNAGTSFCNKLYWNILRYIEKEKLETKMVFVHIPFEKNITDFEHFREQIFEVMGLQIVIFS